MITIHRWVCLRAGWDVGWVRLGCSTSWHVQKTGAVGRLVGVTGCHSELLWHLLICVRIRSVVGWAVALIDSSKR